MEKWSVLAGRCNGLMLWDRKGNGETRMLADERGMYQHCQKYVLPVLSWQTGSKSYQGTCASNTSTIWALNPEAQDSKSPHLLLLGGKKRRKKKEKREENFPSDFRFPVWAGAEVARSRAKQREPTQRSGFGACHQRLRKLQATSSAASLQSTAGQGQHILPVKGGRTALCSASWKQDKQSQEYRMA